MSDFSLAIGAEFSFMGQKYKLERYLGSGVYGEVYESTCVLTGEKCAFKVALLRDLTKSKTKVVSEGRVTVSYTPATEAQAESKRIEKVLENERRLLKIQYPDFPIALECGEAASHPVVILKMPYLGEKTIATVFCRYNAKGSMQGPILTDKTKSVAEKYEYSLDESMLGQRAYHLIPGLLGALIGMQQKGITHHDVKSSNIVLDGMVPSIVDFGSASVDGDDPLSPKSKNSTPEYRTPSSIWGERLGEPEMNSKGKPRFWARAQNHGKTSDINAMGYTILEMFGFDIYEDINRYLKGQKKIARMMIDVHTKDEEVEEFRQESIDEVQRRITNFIDLQVRALLPIDARDSGVEVLICKILKGMTMVDDAARWSIDEIGAYVARIKSILTHSEEALSFRLPDAVSTPLRTASAMAASQSGGISPARFIKELADLF